MVPLLGPVPERESVVTGGRPDVGGRIGQENGYSLSGVEGVSHSMARRLPCRVGGISMNATESIRQTTQSPRGVLPPPTVMPPSAAWGAAAKVAPDLNTVRRGPGRPRRASDRRAPEPSPEPSIDRARAQRRSTRRGVAPIRKPRYCGSQLLLLGFDHEPTDRNVEPARGGGDQASKLQDHARVCWRRDPSSSGAVRPGRIGTPQQLSAPSAVCKRSHSHLASGSNPQASGNRPVQCTEEKGEYE